VSAREYEVLSLIAAGLTHAQAARRLGISHHTVDTYVKRLRVRLGPGNKAHLVRMAAYVTVDADGFGPVATTGSASDHVPSGDGVVVTRAR